MTHLKPCPFCGGQAETRLDGRWWVHCVDCTCEIGFEGMDENGYSGHFETEAKAIDAWNTRTERTTSMYRDNHGIWHCENCEHGADRLTGSNGALDAWEDSWAPNYCPNCGAKVVSE